MTTRTQITMDPSLRLRAHQRAAQLGLSFAEYVRRVVASDLGENRRKGDVAAVFDLVTEGARTDIARNKDRMLADAVDREHRRKTRGKSARPARTRAEIDRLR